MNAEEWVTLLIPLTHFAMLAGRDANAAVYGSANRERTDPASNPA